MLRRFFQEAFCPSDRDGVRPHAERAAARDAGELRERGFGWISYGTWAREEQDLEGSGRSREVAG